ncbi:MAG: N-acetylgalactosamine-6-sulfatase, partial [Rubripirellula sp.]
EHVVDGSSMRSLLLGKADPSRSEQFLMHYPHGQHRSNYFTVWRDGDWKVVYHALPSEKTTGGFLQTKDGHYQLFNLREDPFESTNLVASRPNELKRMMKAMIEQLEQHEAVYPVDQDGNALRPQLPKE